MTSIGQYNNLAIKTAVAVIAVSVVYVASILIRAAKLPEIPSAVKTQDSSINCAKWIEPASLADCAWSVIHSSNSSMNPSSGSVSQSFRLAGTFIAYGGQNDKRRAILDDLRARRQKIVAENEEIDDFIVLRIFTDRIVVKGHDGEEQLWLNFSSSRQATNESKQEDSNDNIAFVPKEGRFGSQVGENSYVFNRDALLSYYNELMNEPQRLVTVFDSLKPIWTEDRKISGYHLDIEGEADFFKEIGWQQGDIVRAVNSMEMSNRHRAEYFIREFVADRANAFLMDMERGDEQIKMVYRVR